MTEKNSIMLLNDIIYKIYTIEDTDKMRKILLEALQYLIPCPVSTFYLASSEVPYELERPVGIGLKEERWQLYLDQFQNLDYTRWTFAAPSAKVYRETDLMHDEARINTPYYKAMFAPSKIHYSAIVTIIHEGVFLGVINLFRSREEGDFTDEEIFFLDMLKSHLSYRLFQSLQNQKDSCQKKQLSKEDLMQQYSLTPRETEVVFLMLDGTSKSSICDQLCISPNTLKKHTLNLYKKLNIKSWRELFSLVK